MQRRRRLQIAINEHPLKLKVDAVHSGRRSWNVPRNEFTRVTITTRNANIETTRIDSKEKKVADSHSGKARRVSVIPRAISPTQFRARRPNFEDQSANLTWLALFHSATGSEGSANREQLKRIESYPALGEFNRCLHENLVVADVRRRLGLLEKLPSLLAKLLGL